MTVPKDIPARQLLGVPTYIAIARDHLGGP